MSDEGPGAVFDAHVRAEFVERSVDATMGTMTNAPYVIHVPVMTGGHGRDEVRAFYTDWFVGREIGTALALVVSSWPIGIGIALIVLPWIAITSSVPMAFLSTAIAAALVLVLVAAIYRPPAKAAVVPETGSSVGLSWRETGSVSLAGAIWGLFNVGCIIVLSFTPSLLSAQGISARDAGIATSFASWTLISTMVLGGILLDRIGYATALMMTSFAVLGLSMMLLPSASSFALIAFIGAVAGLPCAAMLVLPSEVLRPQSRAPGMGLFYTWYYVGMTLLTPAAGLARDLSGNPGAPLIVAGSLELAAIAVLGIFRMLQRRHGISVLALTPTSERGQFTEH